MGRFDHVLYRGSKQTIGSFARQWRDPAPGRVWADRLRSCLDALVPDDEPTLAEASSLLVKLESYEAPLSTHELIALRQRGLATRPDRSSLLSGWLTITDLASLDLVPHKLIVLLGLDARTFPRRAGRGRRGTPCGS